MIKILSILYAGLWYILGISIYLWIFQEPSLYPINFIIGSIFILIWGFHTVKFLKSPQIITEDWMFSYKNLEIISLIIQIIFLLFLLTGILYRIISEWIPVFG